MNESSRIPIFPPPAVAERVIELGFLSGPWTRQELSFKWGESVANRFIQDAKGYGWIVSPYPNEFYVPPANDLMVVGWLPQPQRREFIISRTLAATQLKYWSMSSWLRDRGLETSEPLFVTDLSPVPSVSSFRDRVQYRRPSQHEIMERNAETVRTLKRVPFLESLIIVPEIPQVSRLSVPVRTLLTNKPTSKPFRFDWLMEEGGVQAEQRKAMSLRAWQASIGGEIRYMQSPGIDDIAWVIALLIALDLPRITEALPKIVQNEVSEEMNRSLGTRPRALKSKKEIETEFLDRVSNWGAFFGQAAPNDGWQRTLSAKVFPYMLMPLSVWSELTSGASSKGYEAVRNLRRYLTARPAGSG